jgi:hypothetical protein
MNKLEKLIHRERTQRTQRKELAALKKLLCDLCTTNVQDIEFVLHLSYGRWGLQ